MNDKKSKISERLKWLTDSMINIKTEDEVFVGKYIDSILVGKSYFIMINDNNKTKMINTDGILSIKQL